ncbi:MAG: 5-formyltetrahydrofolate cyclo-ligase [Actinobacteria bacterium]|nr:MAG: 5-formyltetrahydrofolate cyclo-ligase [Actinomycetota bacterium]
MMRPVSTADDKRALRARACEARDAIAPRARTAASEAACANLVALPELADARLVLGYAAVGTELDPAAALDHLHALGVRIAYPRVEGTTALSLHVCAREALQAGAYGIPEPPVGAPAVAPHELDAAVVPGVAFDSACARLGHGAGYYDRLLPELRADAPLIGLAFDEQVVGRLPDETHDVPMDVVVTPDAVYRRP